MSNVVSARVFTTSLKPAWSDSQIKEFVRRLKGNCVVHAITHDFDKDDKGFIEPHTHFLIEYDTPRKISTVANLFGVESNFIEVVKSKKAMLRYLTHMDDSEKHRYDSANVISNSTVSYDDLVMGQNLSDKEIAKYLQEGRGVELLGVVSASKLRTIQSFLQFENTNKMGAQLRRMNENIAVMSAALNTIQDVVLDFQKGFTAGVSNFIPHMVRIAEAVERATLRIKK